MAGKLNKPLKDQLNRLGGDRLPYFLNPARIEDNLGKDMGSPETYKAWVLEKLRAQDPTVFKFFQRKEAALKSAMRALQACDQNYAKALGQVWGAWLRRNNATPATPQGPPSWAAKGGLPGPTAGYGGGVDHNYVFSSAWALVKQHTGLNLKEGKFRGREDSARELVRQVSAAIKKGGSEGRKAALFFSSPEKVGKLCRYLEKMDARYHKTGEDEIRQLVNSHVNGLKGLTRALTTARAREKTYAPGAVGMGGAYHPATALIKGVDPKEGETTEKADKSHAGRSVASYRAQRITRLASERSNKLIREGLQGAPTSLRKAYASATPQEKRHIVQFVAEVRGRPQELEKLGKLYQEDTGGLYRRHFGGQAHYRDWLAAKNKAVASRKEVRPEDKILTFGKYRGMRLWQVIDKDPGYYAYLLQRKDWHHQVDPALVKAYYKTARSPAYAADLRPYVGDLGRKKARDNSYAAMGETNPADLYRGTWRKVARPVPGKWAFEQGARERASYEEQLKKKLYKRSKDEYGLGSFATSDPWQREERKGHSRVEQGLGAPHSFLLNGTDFLFNPDKLLKPLVSRAAPFQPTANYGFRRQEERRRKTYDPSYYAALQNYEYGAPLRNKLAIDAQIKSTFGAVAENKWFYWKARRILEKQILEHIHVEMISDRMKSYSLASMGEAARAGSLSAESQSAFRGEEYGSGGESNATVRDLRARGYSDKEARGEYGMERQGFSFYDTYQKFTKAQSREELLEHAREFEEFHGTLPNPDGTPNATGLAWQGVRAVDQGLDYGGVEAQTLEDVFWERLNTFPAMKGGPPK